MRYAIAALCLAASATAAAQPQPPPQPPLPDPMQPGPQPQPEPQPQPQPEPPQPRPAAPMQPVAPPAPVDGARPTEWALAIGLGYALPTSLQTPNTTSVRLRFASGITIEPQLVLASSTSEVDTGESMKNSASEVGVSALVRFPLVRRGRVDLELCGGLLLNRSSEKPMEPDMDVSVSSFSATYGVAVATWLSPHWQVSLTALNPLITTTKRDAENPVGNTVTTNTTIGLIFDPGVALMVHLYH